MPGSVGGGYKLERFVSFILQGFEYVFDGSWVGRDVPEETGGFGDDFPVARDL